MLKAENDKVKWKFLSWQKKPFFNKIPPKITLAAKEKGKNVKISDMAELYISFLEDGSAHGLIVFLQLQAVGRHNAHGFFFDNMG